MEVHSVTLSIAEIWEKTGFLSTSSPRLALLQIVFFFLNLDFHGICTSSEKSILPVCTTGGSDCFQALIKWGFVARTCTSRLLDLFFTRLFEAVLLGTIKH